jgi:hypothetical protein
MNRREMLQSGIAATALPVVGGTGWLPAPQRGHVRVQPLPLYKVIIDQRVGEARAFGREMLKQGLAVQPFDGDMTNLWYDDLYPRWRRNPVAIAGLTAHGPLFCLERLAWDFRMRVVLRADHRRAAKGSFARALTGQVSLQDAAAGAVLTDAEHDTLISWVIAPVTRP